MFQSKTRQEAKILKEEEHMSELPDNFKWPNMRVTGVPQRRGETKTTEKKNLNKGRAEKYPVLMKTLCSQIQAAQ